MTPDHCRLVVKLIPLHFWSLALLSRLPSTPKSVPLSPDTSCTDLPSPSALRPPRAAQCLARAPPPARTPPPTPPHRPRPRPHSSHQPLPQPSLHSVLLPFPLQCTSVTPHFTECGGGGWGEVWDIGRADFQRGGRDERLGTLALGAVRHQVGGVPLPLLTLVLYPSSSSLPLTCLSLPSPCICELEGLYLCLSDHNE